MAGAKQATSNNLYVPMITQFTDAYQGYPAKRALSAMRKHGG